MFIRPGRLSPPIETWRTRLKNRNSSVNEADAYYAGKLSGVRQASGPLRLLDESAAGARKRSDQSTAGGVSNWTLTDALDAIGPRRSRRPAGPFRRVGQGHSAGRAPSRNQIHTSGGGAGGSF